MSSDDKQYTYNEVDVMMRLVDPLFDMTWSWTQTFDQEKLLEKMRKRAAFESSASKSVSSKMSTIDASLADLTMNEKIALLEKNLKNVKRHFNDSFFEDISTAFSLSQNLYPGFKDIDFIARYIYRENDKYKGLLSADEIEQVSLAGLMKYGFFGLAKFLLEHKNGHEALKFIILPNKVTNATYDICRKRFCTLLVDEIDIVTYQFNRLARAIRKQVKVSQQLTEENLEKLESNDKFTHDAETQTDVDVPVDNYYTSVEEPLKDPIENNVKDVVHDTGVDDAEGVVEQVNDNSTTEIDASAGVEMEPEKESSEKSFSVTSKRMSDFPTPLGQILNNMWSMSSPNNVFPPYWGNTTKRWQPSVSDEDD